MDERRAQEKSCRPIRTPNRKVDARCEEQGAEDERREEVRAPCKMQRRREKRDRKDEESVHDRLPRRGRLAALDQLLAY